MKHILLLLTLLSIGGIQAQEKPAYRIYNSQGERVAYDEMVKTLAQSEVLLFGEQHNNAIAHWLQYEVTKDLFATRRLVLGAEMLEADNQAQLDDYLSGTIDAKAYDSTVRLWSNYDTDYAKLVDFAKENDLRFIATNIPRRYASTVYKKGFEGLDDLSKEELSWIAPLPIAFDPELPRYKEILSMMGEHGTPELVMAQAIKDATMAHFIRENRKKKELFVHYNGRYHSDYYEGIMWYLKSAQPKLKCASISTVEQEDIDSLEDENMGVADFVICVDSDMTTTY